jgi:two-component system chemotaxis sensor kinase CheA
MDEFEKELKLGFLEEATQLLAEVESCLLVFEKDPENPATLDQIFRIAHNIKGSSKAVGFMGMGDFAHEFESFLLRVKNRELKPTRAIADLTLRSVDHLNMMVGQLKENLDAQFDSRDLLAALHNPPTETVETSTAPSEGSTPPQASAHLFDLKAPPPPAMHNQPKSGADESIRVSLSRVEKLINFVGEIMILNSVLREQLRDADPLIRKTSTQLHKITKEIQDLSMSLRMMPLKPTFQKMQRIVRDTSTALGKDVNLILTGEETEVDKTILECLTDPLVHIIRNSVDHGIEASEKRLERSKSKAGTVELKAFHQSGKLVIQIMDDGGGIDTERLKAKAIERGVLAAGKELTHKEALHLIFHPGLSTKAEVTDISGRGVGMDVVKTNVEKIQGEIEIESQFGKGSCFTIILPLTLAIVDAMILREGDAKFVLPLAQVQESLILDPSNIKTARERDEILLLRDQTLPLFRLSKLLGVQTKKTVTDQMIVVSHAGNFSFAVVVDEIIEQTQIVIKTLGSELRHLQGFSGSTILGDGHPALILELIDLVKIYSKKSTRL